MKSLNFSSPLLRRTPALACVSTLLALLCVTTAPAWSEETAAAASDEPAPEFNQKVMSDPANIEAGKQVWDGQCRHCHGNSAYPGKAPKLKPSSYQPDFVYDRVTNGFRKMPSWKAVFNQKQRIGVVTFIMSPAFDP